MLRRILSAYYTKKAYRHFERRDVLKVELKAAPKPATELKKQIVLEDTRGKAAFRLSRIYE